MPRTSRRSDRRIPPSSCSSGAAWTGPMGSSPSILPAGSSGRSSCRSLPTTCPVPSGHPTDPASRTGPGAAQWTLGRSTCTTHVIAADGTGDRALPDPPGAVWNAGSAWSNDGTSLLIVRGYGRGYEDVRAGRHPVRRRVDRDGRSRTTGSSTRVLCGLRVGAGRHEGPRDPERHRTGTPLQQVIDRSATPVPRRPPRGRRPAIRPGSGRLPDRPPDKVEPRVGRDPGFRKRRLGCGEGIRTLDLRVMSPTSCRCSTPRRNASTGSRTPATVHQR